MVAVTEMQKARKRDYDRSYHTKKRATSEARYEEGSKRYSKLLSAICIGVDGEAHHGKYDLLAGNFLSPDGRQHIKRISTPLGERLGLEHALTFWLDMYYTARGLYKKLTNEAKYRMVRFLWFNMTYDIEQLIIGSDISDEKKYALSRHGSRTYGAIRERGYEPYVFLEDSRGRPWSIKKTKRTLVCRLHRYDEQHNILRDEKGKAICIATLYHDDTFGFTATSFRKTIESVILPAARRGDLTGIDLDIVERAYALVCEGKEAREDWEAVGWNDAKIQAYNDSENFLECLFGAILQNACLFLGIHPQSFAGPAALAHAFMQKYGALEHVRPDCYDTLEWQQGEIHAATRLAMRGGRIENARMGFFPNYYEADIHSAYPAMMRYLPCGTHGDWQEYDGDTATQLAQNSPNERERCILYQCAWFKNGEQEYGPFPMVDKQGCVSFPLTGSGYIWQPEIAAYGSTGPEDGPTVVISHAYEWVSTCSCTHPFAFTEMLYAYREQLKREEKGEQLFAKLGYNSMYGKLAQKLGSYCIVENGKIIEYHTPKTQNLMLAGLITSWTRATLYDAYCNQAPGSVIGFATDALLMNSRPVRLQETDALGDWEITEGADAIIVQPGLRAYTDVKTQKRVYKSRGFSIADAPSFFDRVEAAWQEHVHEKTFHGTKESMNALDIPVKVFHGLKQHLRLKDGAYSYHDEEKLGTITNEEKYIMIYGDALSSKRESQWDVFQILPGTHRYYPPKSSEYTLIAPDYEIMESERCGDT